MVQESDRVDKTTIQVSVETKKQLDALGTKTDTYEDIIKRLLESQSKNSN